MRGKVGHSGSVQRGEHGRGARIHTGQARHVSLAVHARERANLGRRVGQAGPWARTIRPMSARGSIAARYQSVADGTTETARVVQDESADHGIACKAPVGTITTGESPSPITGFRSARPALGRCD